MGKRDGGFVLPEELEPTDWVCITFRVPAQREYIRATYGAVSQLTRWYNWQRDDREGGKRAGEIFLQVMLDAYETEGECMDGETLAALLECCQAQTEILADLLECCQQQAKIEGGAVSKLIDILGPHYADTEKRLKLIDDIDGDLSKTHPDAPLDTFTKGTLPGELLVARKAALCRAIRDTIKIVLSRVAAEYDAQQPGIVDIGSMFAGLLLGPNNGALAGVLITLANYVLDNWQDDVFFDSDAIDEVACHMYQFLKGKTTDSEYFAKCLDDFSGSTNANLIADVMKEAVRDYANFLLFVRQLGINYKLAVDNDWDADLCFCGEDETWIHSWDFPIEDALSPYSWGVTEGTFDNDFGVICQAQVKFASLQESTITRVQVTTGTTGENPTGSNLSFYVVLGVGQGERVLIGGLPALGMNEQEGEWEIAEGELLNVGLWHSVPEGTDPWTILRITWFGTGLNPFGYDHDYPPE